MISILAGLAGWFPPLQGSETEWTYPMAANDEKIQTFDASLPFTGDRNLLWEVLTDYDNFHTFQPGIKESRLLPPGEDGGKRLAQTIVHQFLFFKKQLRIVLQLEEQPKQKVEFSLLEGDFEVYEGSWILESDEENTRLRLILRVAPSFSVPSLILVPVVRKSAEKSLHSVIDETYRRQSTR